MNSLSILALLVASVAGFELAPHMPSKGYSSAPYGAYGMGFDHKNMGYGYGNPSYYGAKEGYGAYYGNYPGFAATRGTYPHSGYPGMSGNKGYGGYGSYGPAPAHQGNLYGGYGAYGNQYAPAYGMGYGAVPQHYQAYGYGYAPHY